MQEQVAQHQLTWSQQRAFDDAYNSERRVLWKAYMLGIFLGAVGAHRFYLGRRPTGLVMLCIWLAGFLMTVFVALAMPDQARVDFWSTIAGLMMLAMWTWEIVDLFLIPLMARKFNAHLARELMVKAQALSTE